MKSPRNLYRLLLVSIASLAGFVQLGFMQGCSQRDDEALVRASVDSIIKAVENKERRAIREHLAKDFLAQRNHGKADIERIMLVYFRQNPKISIYRMEEDVQINGDRADVSLVVTVTGANNLLPERVGSYQVDMLWRKYDDEWLLSRLNWQRNEVFGE